jgi:hypothetical protein
MKSFKKCRRRMSAAFLSQSLPETDLRQIELFFQFVHLFEAHSVGFETH